MILNLGVAIPIRVMRHFPRDRDMYLAFVRNPFVADSNVVNVFNGNDATPEKFIAPKVTARGRDDVFLLST